MHLSGNSRGADPNNPTAAVPEQETPNRTSIEVLFIRVSRYMYEIAFWSCIFNLNSFFTQVDIKKHEHSKILF